MTVISGKNRWTKWLFLAFCSVILWSCSGKGEGDNAEVVPISLNEENVVVFARQIEQSVLNDNPDFFNNAFDESALREALRANSIVFSSLDADFGKELFAGNLLLGDFEVGIINNGGDFKFVKYYEKEGEHHVVFRTYIDFGLRIDDYIVDSADNELKIRDGFLYNFSTSFVKNVEYSMFYSIMQRTNAGGETIILATADSLLRLNKAAQAAQLLEQNDTLLHDYPYFWQLLTHAKFKSNPAQFIRFLDQNKHRLDERTILIHKLLYYANGGFCNETEATVNALIEHTGDDPIYLFFYAHACYVAGKYEEAIACLHSLDNALPPLWDIWEAKLNCYYKLNEEVVFVETLLMGQELYNLQVTDLQALIDKNYPKMKAPFTKTLKEKESEQR